MKQKSLKKNALLNVIRTIMGLIYPLITFPYASRILLPEGIGKVNFANSIISYFGLMASLGISTYSIREASKVRDDKIQLSQFAKEMLIINLFSTAAAYLLFFISLFTIPKFSSYRLLLLISSSTILFSTLGLEWLYGAVEEYAYITIRSILFQFLTLFALFIFVKTKEDYVVYAATGILSSVGSNICNFIHARKYIDFRTGLPLKLRKHLKPIFIFFGTNLAISVFTILDTSMLGFLTDDIQVGFYTAATKLTRMIRNLFPAVFTVLFARLSITGTKDENYFKELIGKTLDFILCFSLPIIAGLFILGKPIILLLSGENYIDALPSMYIMIPIIFLSSWAGFLGGSVLNSLGKEKIYLYCVIAGATINAILNFFFIKVWGSFGASLSTLLTECFFAMVYTILIWPYILKRKIFVKSFQYIFSTIFMTLVCLTVNHFLSENVPKLIFVSLSGMFVYFLCLLFFKNEMLINILSLMKNKLKGKLSHE